MSSLLAVELSATCSALGYNEITTNKYYADENVLETLKDLIRYLRRDEETRDVRRQLGETNVLVTDLLPLLKSYWEQNELFDVLLRLLVNLTTPPLILWDEEVPTDRNARNYYLQIEDHLHKYKQAFTDDAIWAILSTKLSRILEMDYTERGEENGLVIERILILVRNVLYVPTDRENENRPDNDANLHDQVLWALRQSGMLDIVLYMASSNSEQVYYLHIIELLSFLLREQSPQSLANSALERNQLEKQEDDIHLLSVRLQENREKREKLKKFTGARHSRFGGTFVIKSMKAIGENELIYHKPLNDFLKMDFDAHKAKLKTPKNRLPIKEMKSNRNSAFIVRVFLKEFCIEFLNGAYNTFMHYIMRVLARAAPDTHDESYYFWGLRFFMEFNRLHKNELKLISETISKESFHYVQQRMEHHFDMIQNDKKKFRLWSKRLHLALLAYRELLLTLSAMDKSNDNSIVESARIIKSNIFYTIEYRELVLTLLITFDELKMSNIYLTDLIETQHIFIKMLETFCKQTGGVVVAQRKRSKKKKSQTEVITTSTPHELSDEITSDLSAALTSHESLPEVETTLKFDDFTKRLSHPKIVSACGLCLKNFNSNSIFTNHCVIKLLHRIAFDCKMYVLLFQATIFRTFQQIYSMKDIQQYRELVKFATYIMRQFFRIADINPKVYMEVLFWKSNREAVEIEQGYGSYHKTQNSSKVWTEVEENEIRTLHEEFLSKEIDDDIVDWITNNLVDNTKSRRIVLKKMRELGLLNNYPPKKLNKKRNKPWTDNEENELQELYELYRESDDPLTAIISNLSIDRPKNRIIEKLLVMGLISDRSELRKKRKGNNKKSNNHSENKSTTRKPKTKPVRKLPQLSEVKTALLRLKENNVEQALHWLSETLSDAANDLENAHNIDEDEGIPVVPLMDYCETAFEDEIFKNLLRGLGLLEPTDEQIYWRIPNSMEPATLKGFSELILNCDTEENLEETKSVTEIESGVNTISPNNINASQQIFHFDSASDDEVTRNSDSDDDSSSDNENKIEPNALNNDSEISEPTLNKNVIYDDEDENSHAIDNESKRTRNNSDSDVDYEKPQKKKKRIFILSSDEE